MSYPKPHRISIKDTAKFLNLPDARTLLNLRAACKRGALPCIFPTLRQGEFIVSEVDAFKIELNAIIAQAGNTQPPTPTVVMPQGRRVQPDRRKR